LKGFGVAFDLIEERFGALSPRPLGSEPVRD
jgi:hypothetical protein